MTYPEHSKEQESEPSMALSIRIPLVMAEAREACVAAVAAAAERDADAFMHAPPGGAYVYALKPSFAFRTAMIEAGEMEASISGRWTIGRFQDAVDDRSLLAADTACRAALKVLQAHFPDERLFSTCYPT